MPFPSDTPVTFDDFNRADGTLQAGGGASIWTADALGGGSGGWTVASNTATTGSGGNHLSLAELPADFELVLDVVTVGGGYFALFFCVQNPSSAGGGGYWFFIDSGAWQFKREVAGTLASAASPSMSAGDKIGIRRAGSTLEAYHYPSGGPWDTDPIVTVEDSTITAGGPIALEAQFWAIDNIAAVGLEPVDPVRPAVHVDPDHEDASDAYTRAQALNPATPLATLAAAILLVETGDDIEMAPSEDQYVATAIWSIEATDVLVRGRLQDGETDQWQEWDIAYLGLRALTGWTFQDFTTHGTSQAAASYAYECTDLTFRRWRAQRGGGNFARVLGDWLWDQCSVQAPLDSPAANYLDGVGWRLVHLFEGQSEIGNVEFRDCEWSNVQGEDGVQFIGNTFHTGELRFTRCHWHDFEQSDQPDAPHTDGVQCIGANHVVFTDCLMERLPSMIITSDDLVHSVLLENCTFHGTAEGSYPTQFSCLEGSWTAVNCTWADTGLGLRFARDPALGITNPVIELVNCIVDILVFSTGIDDPENEWAATITIGDECLIGVGPITHGGTRGFAEYGHTGSSPNEILLELANAPDGTNALAIDAGVSPDDDERVPLLDRLGRARNGAAPDLGAQESDPDTEVPADPRPPRVIGPYPEDTATGVDRTTQVKITLFPRPGQTLDETTINTETVRVLDPGDGQLPIEIAVTSPDENGYQIIVLDILGQLYPYVRYRPQIDATISDSEGSELAHAAQWLFTTIGGAGAAVYPASGGPVGGWTVGALA